MSDLLFIRTLPGFSEPHEARTPIVLRRLTTGQGMAQLEAATHVPFLGDRNTAGGYDFRHVSDKMCAAGPGPMPITAILISKLAAARSVDAVIDTIAHFLVKRGAARLSYHHLPPLGAPDRDRSVGVASWNFPDDWVATYTTGNFWRIDPIPRLALTLARPFWWSEVSLLATLRPAERDYMTSLRRAHLGDGLAIPVFGPRGRDGYIGLGCPPGRRMFTPTEIARFQMACQLGHQRYCQILIGDGVAPDPEDALRWYARAARRGDAHAMALLADALADTDPRRARALFAQASEQGHAYAARRLTHRLAFPPGETKVTAKGGFGENQ